MKGVPGRDFDPCYARRLQVTDNGVVINVVGLEDLDLLEEASGRPQDLEDARTLREIARR